MSCCCEQPSTVHQTFILPWILPTCSLQEWQQTLTDTKLFLYLVRQCLPSLQLMTPPDNGLLWGYWFWHHMLLHLPKREHSTPSPHHLLTSGTLPVREFVRWVLFIREALNNLCCYKSWLLNADIFQGAYQLLLKSVLLCMRHVRLYREIKSKSCRYRKVRAHLLLYC